MVAFVQKIETRRSEEKIVAKKVKKKKESKSWKEKKLNCKIIRKISALTGFAAIYINVCAKEKKKQQLTIIERVRQRERKRGRRRSSCYCNFRVRKVSSRNGE